MAEEKVPTVWVFLLWWPSLVFLGTHHIPATIIPFVNLGIVGESVMPITLLAFSVMRASIIESLDSYFLQTMPDNERCVFSDLAEFLFWHILPHSWRTFCAHPRLRCDLRSATSGQIMAPLYHTWASCVSYGLCNAHTRNHSLVC